MEKAWEKGKMKDATCSSLLFVGRRGPGACVVQHAILQGHTQIHPDEKSCSRELCHERHE